MKRLTVTVLLLTLAGAAFGQSSTGPLSVEDQSISDASTSSAANSGNQDQGSNQQGIMMLMQQIQQYQKQIEQLRNTVEQLQHQVDTMKSAARDRYMDLDTRINALAEASLKQTKEDGKGDQEQAGNGKQSTDKAGDRDAYMAARDKLLNKDFPAARKAFEQYLKDYPKGQFRPFAHFWLGETYRVLPDVGADKAMAEFKTVINKYPDSSKVPAAMYKLASLQADQGKTQAAEVTLNKILMKYPDTSEARLAKSMLDQLGADDSGKK